MKRWRQIAIAFVGVFLSAAWLWPARGENVPVVMAHPLAAALQATGAELDRGYFTGDARLADCDEAEAAQLANRALAALGLQKARVSEEQVLGEAGRRYTLCARAGQTTAKIALQRPAEAGRLQRALRLRIELWREGLQAEEIASLQNKIRAAIENLAGIPRISTCLEGHLDGKLRKGQRRLALEDAFAAVGAAIAARTETDAYESYAGYTPLLRSAARSGGLRLNLNAAARYHAYDGATHVLVGSPLIAVPY